MELAIESDAPPNPRPGDGRRSRRPAVEHLFVRPAATDRSRRVVVKF